MRSCNSFQNSLKQVVEKTHKQPCLMALKNTFLKASSPLDPSALITHYRIHSPESTLHPYYVPSLIIVKSNVLPEYWLIATSLAEHRRSSIYWTTVLGSTSTLERRMAAVALLPRSTSEDGWINGEYIWRATIRRLSPGLTGINMNNKRTPQW